MFQSERDAQIQLNALAEVMRKNAGLLPTSTGLPTLPLDYQGMMETLYPNAFDPATLSVSFHSFLLCLLPKCFQSV